MDAAKALVAAGRVEVKTREDVPGLFIETILQTDCDEVRALTLNHHTNSVRVEHAPFAPYVPGENAHAENPLRAYKLSDMVGFAQSVPLHELGFLREGIEMNLAVAKAGMEFGLGRAMRTPDSGSVLVPFNQILQFLNLRILRYITILIGQVLLYLLNLLIH